MRFLVPELHVRLNSPDDDQAIDADEAIEAAGEQYNEHWDRIKAQVPTSVIQFAEQEMLHDADIFGPAVLPNGEVILVAQNIATLHADRLNTLMFLYYAVTEEPQVDVPVVSDAFSRMQPHWLWDEFDVIDSKTFSHSILLSDGRVVAVRFQDFRYEVANLVAPELFRNLRAGNLAKAI